MRPPWPPAQGRWLGLSASCIVFSSHFCGALWALNSLPASFRGKPLTASWRGLILHWPPPFLPEGTVSKICKAKAKASGAAGFRISRVGRERRRATMEYVIVIAVFTMVGVYALVCERCLRDA